MTGSVQEKNGYFYSVLNYTDDHGKRKQKWIGTGLPVRGNKRKAEIMLNELLKKYTDEDFSVSAKTFFCDFLEKWVENKKGKIEVSTWESYDMYVRKHIVPYFKKLNLTLKQVTPNHILDFYNYEFRNGRCDGKGGLSIPSIRVHGIVIKEALNEAVIRELINRNPALNVPLPKKEKEKVIGTFLNAEQANQLIKVFRGNRLQPIVYITLYYGLRRSEVLGLKWNAIDFKNDTMTIQHTVVENYTIVEKDRTKSPSSHRTFQLLPEIKKMLQRQYKEILRNKQTFGNTYHDSGYVFTWEDGRLYRPDYITSAFQKVLKKNKLPHMRFHDLRHSTASILYDKGWGLKDIQTWLGHADIKVTGNIYTHISELRKQAMAKNLENTFTL